ncbi:hypothetical protein ES702_06193 [subsurface metagenome]
MSETFQKPNKKNINLIGFKIGAIFNQINKIINKTELEYFIDYSNQFDALYPLLNPTAYMKMPHGTVNKAKKRAKTLLEVLKAT